MTSDCRGKDGRDGHDARDSHDSRDSRDSRDSNTAEEGHGQEAAAEMTGEAVVLPITDVLDLHSFLPRDVAGVVGEYLEAAYAKELRHLRIIHGRGTGVQRQIVRTLLGRDSRVEAFGDAPPEAGGWGATWVRLR
jgi:DNA-nicking Smr family endonuclease